MNQWKPANKLCVLYSLRRLVHFPDPIFGGPLDVVGVSVLGLEDENALESGFLAEENADGTLFGLASLAGNGALLVFSGALGGAEPSAAPLLHLPAPGLHVLGLAGSAACFTSGFGIALAGSAFAIEELLQTFSAATAGALRFSCSWISAARFLADSASKSTKNTLLLS